MSKNISRGAVLPNPLTDLISSTRMNLSNIFSQELVFMLNRSSGTRELLLILGFLYRVFIDTSTELPNLFYTNDLKSIVDVVMRELLNGRDDEVVCCLIQ